MRIYDIIHTYLSKQQFGFTKNRGAADAVSFVRQIVEKAKEHQVPLQFSCVDFKATFDAICRGAL